MKKRKILLVDDEVAFTNIVKLTLEMGGHYEVRVENDPFNAVAKGREFGPDLILLDVIMPELDGGEIYREFMADLLLRHTPIIFLTAIVRPEEVKANSGMFAGKFFIAKPVCTEELTEAIEKRLSSGISQELPHPGATAAAH